MARESFAAKFSTIRQDPEWFELRNAEGDIEGILDEYIGENFGPSVYEAAWEEFELFGESRVNRDEYEDLFKSWMHYTWLVSDRFVEGNEHVTFAELCLSEFPEHFGLYHFRIVQAAIETPFTFFLVKNVIKGQGLILQDIMLRKEVIVKEYTASLSLAKGVILFGRSIKIDNQSIFLGLGPYSLPNRFFDEIIAYRSHMLKEMRSDEITSDELLDDELGMRRIYFYLLEKAFKPMRFTNYDQEPIEINEIEYDLQCTTKQAFEALLSLCPEQDKVTWEERAMDDDGNTIISWVGD